MKTYLKTEEIPVTKQVDVLVVGGGPAGVAAAFAAARMGAKTLIVEQFNCLGGVATAGGHGHTGLYSVWGGGDRIVGGIPLEMVERVARGGYGTYDGCVADFQIEGMKLVLERMAGEAGVELLYHTFFCESLVEGNAVVGAVVQNKSGRQAIEAKRVIDCTGDGDVAATAGCEFETGNPKGLCQPVTLMFNLDGVDFEKVRAARPDFRWEAIWKKAQDNGDMRPFQSQIMGWWWTPTRPTQLGVNFTHVTHVDSTKAEDLTAATIEARKQVLESVEIYRKYVPGMENCYLSSTPNTIGIRESRRILGDYMLTREDVVEQRTFDDTIGYGSFYIDIHNVSGPGMDRRTFHPELGSKYQIPYRILVPKTVENLLVAGRCASCTHEALGSLRVMPQCGVMGQAAGVASALSLQGDHSPRAVDIKRLQAELKNQGCILDEEDIRGAN